MDEMYAGTELSHAFERKNTPAVTVFDDFWPTETRGNGKVVKNNSRTGAAQGKSSLIQKAHCRMCGYPNDMIMIDHSGGSLNGDGAGGQISTEIVSFTMPNGTVHTEGVGTQVPRVNSGCALCFSKNSSGQRVLLTAGNSWNRIQPLGF